MQIQVLYQENLEKCIFSPQKDYKGDQPITCSHFEGDEAQREKGGERLKKRERERERKNKRESGRKGALIK